MMNLSSEDSLFSSPLGSHPFSRSNSLTAFDAIFGNNSMITANDMFEDLFGAEQAPEQVCDQFMHNKELNDVIEDLKQSIEGPMASAPINENFIESDFTGTPSPESGFESHGTPVSVEKAQFQDVFVSPTQSPQVVAQSPSEKVVAFLKQNGYQFDQIMVVDGHLTEPPRQESPIHYEFSPAEVKAEPEFPTSPLNGTKRRSADLDFSSAKKIKKEQNKNASKRYRDRKREEEKKLEEDLKFLENEKNRLDKELVTVQTTNKCRAEEMRRKFASFI